MLHQVPNSVIHATTSTTSHQTAASTDHTFHQATTNMTMEAANTFHQLPNTVHQVIHQMPHTNPLNNANVGNNHEVTTNITDETGNPDKDEHVLHPDGLWFPHRVVVDKVSATSYKSYFKGPYCNWKMTPLHVQQRWWNAFKHEFSWDPSVAKLVKKGWKSKVSRRLTGIVSKVCNEPGYEAEWCPRIVREEMIRIRSEEENQKKAEQCKKNRNGNGDHKIHHRQGSISTDEVRLKLEKKLGYHPSPSEVYYETHADSGGRFVNAKAEAVWNDFKSRKTANLQCEVENRKTEDELFLEATGGWSEKGRIFGLGAAADSFYERPGDRRTKKSRTNYAMEQKRELDETKENLAETQDNLAETQKALAETQRIVEDLHEQFRLIVQANNLSTTPTSTSLS
ncbi:uncharacterized protein [Spinacia oleracea]|uniref:Uncharacterized protein isoform X2 n=1 Tax=Spinacia oleracea TaxID=3562 RepID=A0A9R0IA67_SPIOL|nr:uncharacterized protein LOC110785353 isoform X2 [Spinacia oleracea]